MKLQAFLTFLSSWPAIRCFALALPLARLSSFKWHSFVEWKPILIVWQWRSQLYTVTTVVSTFQGVHLLLFISLKFECISLYMTWHDGPRGIVFLWRVTMLFKIFALKALIKPVCAKSFSCRSKGSSHMHALCHKSTKLNFFVLKSQSRQEHNGFIAYSNGLITLVKNIWLNIAMQQHISLNYTATSTTVLF